MPVVNTQLITFDEYKALHTSAYSYGINLWPIYVNYWTTQGNPTKVAFYQAKLAFDTLAQQSVYAKLLLTTYFYIVPNGATVSEFYDYLTGRVSLIVTA